MTNVEEDSPPYVDIINSAMEFMMPSAHKLGVQAAEVRRGFAAATAPIEGNGNHFGVMYAGVLFTVAEMLGGMLAIPAFDQAEFFPLVKDVHIKFTAMAKTDVRAEASLSDDEIARVAAEATEKGKADYVVEATVTDTSGTVVAVTTATCQLRKQGR